MRRFTLESAATRRRIEFDANSTLVAGKFLDESSQLAMQEEADGWRQTAHQRIRDPDVEDFGIGRPHCAADEDDYERQNPGQVCHDFLFSVRRCARSPAPTLTSVPDRANGIIKVSP